MLPQIQSARIASVLLGLQLFVFLLELLFVFNVLKPPKARKMGRESDNEKWNLWASYLYLLTRHLIAPLFVGLLGVILVPILFSDQGKEFPNLNGRCKTNFDADISGDGIRISIWVQGAVLILISVLGSFHTERSGAKEVGAGLVVTHISLVIAILVQLGRYTLTPVDAIVGSMILDAQNIALSLQLASKETLAARWQVGIVILSQCFGLIALPFIVTRVLGGRFATEECQCVTVFWWAWLSNCSDQQPLGAGNSQGPAAFWIYYAFRLLLYFQSSFHTLMNTATFHIAELQEGATLLGITFPDPLYPPDSGGKRISYNDYPATAALMYTVHAVFAMTSMATAEITIRDFNLQPSSQVFAIGQVIAIVVSLATAARAFWLFVGMFVKSVELPWLPTRKAVRERISRPPTEPEGGTGPHAIVRVGTFVKETRYYKIRLNNPFLLSWQRIRSLYLLPPSDFQAPFIIKAGDLAVKTQIIISDCISGTLHYPKIPAMLILFDVEFSYEINPREPAMCFSSSAITLRFSETIPGEVPIPSQSHFQELVAFAPYITREPRQNVRTEPSTWNYFEIPSDEPPENLQNIIRWSFVRDKNLSFGPGFYTENEAHTARCRLAALITTDTTARDEDPLSLSLHCDIELSVEPIDLTGKERKKKDERTEDGRKNHGRGHRFLEKMEPVKGDLLSLQGQTIKLPSGNTSSQSKTVERSVNRSELQLLRGGLNPHHLEGVSGLPGLHPRRSLQEPHQSSNFRSSLDIRPALYYSSTGQR